MAPLTLDPSRLVGAVTEAASLAARHFHANRTALAAGQPALAGALPGEAPDLDWVFARDGFLTGFESGERWHTGCSVPLLAARAVLKTLDPGAGVACFLCPTHAAQIRVALGRLQPSQALICVIPDIRVLGIILRCDDFAGDVESGRLWFAWGDNWTQTLDRLLDAAPGLPTPTRFIRMPTAEPSVIERLIGDAQRVFTETNARRSAEVAKLRESWTPRGAEPPKRICVVARSTFRLWDDAGHALHAALSADSREAVSFQHFDPDAPAGASSLALAQAACASDVLVAPDMSRADAPTLTPMGMPWITWVTTPRIPPFAAAGPNDRLLLADPAWAEAAAAAGWPGARIAPAGWPGQLKHDSDAPPARSLALIANTHSLDAPESLAEFSSHGLLWDRLRALVLRDPFALPDDVETWVRDQARADGISVETLDVSLLVNRLVVPAYQQALAGALVAAGLPLRLHGVGWDELPRLRPHAAGPITSRDDLRAAVRDAAVLVHAWPTAGAHSIDALGRPIVRRIGRRKETFIRDATLALAGEAGARPASFPSPLSIKLLTQ